MKPNAQGPAGPRDEKERIIDEVFGSSNVVLPAAEIRTDRSPEPCIHPDVVDTYEQKRLERALDRFETTKISDTRVMRDLQRALQLALHAGHAGTDAAVRDTRPDFDLIDEIDESFVIAPLPTAAVEPCDLVDAARSTTTAAAARSGASRAHETNFYVYSTEYQPDLEQIRAWLNVQSRNAAATTGVNLRLLDAFAAPRAIVVRQIDRAGRERVIGVSIVAPAASGLDAGVVGPLVTAKGINLEVRSRALQLAARDHLGNCKEDGPTYFLSRRGNRADTLTLQAFGAQKAKLSDETDPRHELMRRWLVDGAMRGNLVRLLLPARKPSHSYRRLIEYLYGQCQNFNYWTDDNAQDEDLFRLSCGDSVLEAFAQTPKFVLDTRVRKELAQFYHYSHRLFDESLDADAPTDGRRIFHMIYRALAFDASMQAPPRYISSESFYDDVLDAEDEDDQSDAVWTQSKLGELNSAYSAWTTSSGDPSNAGRSLCFGFTNAVDGMKLPRVVAALGSEGARLTA